MVQSLNVSVASALIPYGSPAPAANAGMYKRENSMLPEEEQQRLLFEGGGSSTGQSGKTKRNGFTPTNAQGEVEADDAWWKPCRLPVPLTLAGATIVPKQARQDAV